MTKEVSYGIIPLRRTEQGYWETFLVQLWAGHWGFPKGHAEKGEQGQATAQRELKEETGLSVLRFLSAPPFIESYHFRNGGHLVTKSVTYFLAEVTGDVTLQKAEIKDGRWVPLEEAEAICTYKATKEVCRRAEEEVRRQKSEDRSSDSEF